MFPENSSKLLIKGVQREYNKPFEGKTHAKYPGGKAAFSTDFTPRYNPWDQRLCLVPDGDIFKAIGRGEASIVTEHIDTFTPEGIRLKSGKVLEADLVVTATGLEVRLV
jgi:cation diffusion facilitator CzcD-associated flavoprotein CzcO